VCVCMCIYGAWLTHGGQHDQQFLIIYRESYPYSHYLFAQELFRRAFPHFWQDINFAAFGKAQFDFC
jgi:hypothetical protein